MNKRLAAVLLVLICALATSAFAQKVPIDPSGLLSLVSPDRLQPMTPCYAGTISCAQTKTGRVSVDSCEANGVYGVGYSFNGTQGQKVTITGRSFEFAATIALADGRSGNTTIYAQHDVFRNGDTATISNYTLPYTGPYFILITPGVRYDFGDYTLTLACTSAPAPGGCTASSSTLCLAGNRFSVTVAWKTGASSGAGTAVPLTSDTGYFWFFGSSNIELMVKVLDARTVNGRFWVFYGALSNVAYTITVRDTQTGATRTYSNPSGTFASAGDVNAF
ncbi:MAG TPA: hypothetical protein VNA69_00385 [Thermoanaerobaculia bacterium]|nr:hypothetical protein [Thermoanaerobaculia bacterium]